MSVKFFLDTNILVYSFDHKAPKKREKSLSLIEDGLVSNHTAVSWQIVQEFLNVALTKFSKPFSLAEAKHYYSKVLKPLCKLHSNNEVYLKALTLKNLYKFSFYDSLVIASALSLDAEVLFSEDLQHNQKIEGLEIINPY